MTLEELRREVGPVAKGFDDLAGRAEDDDFAPWVVEALRRAAVLARGALDDPALIEARYVLEERGVLTSAIAESGDRA